MGESKLNEMTLEELKNYMDTITGRLKNEWVKLTMVESLSNSIRNEMNLLGMLVDAELKAIVKIEKLMKENANGNDTGD